jgi:hypothetical protein
MQKRMLSPQHTFEVMLVTEKNVPIYIFKNTVLTLFSQILYTDPFIHYHNFNNVDNDKFPYQHQPFFLCNIHLDQPENRVILIYLPWKFHFLHSTAYNTLLSFFCIKSYWSKPILHKIFFSSLAMVPPYSSYTTYKHAQFQHHSDT